MEKVSIGTYSFGGFDSKLTLPDKLKTAKEIGYTGAEILAAELKNSTAEELKAMFAKEGLECVSVHAGVEQIEELLPKFAEVGGKMMVVPSYSFADREEALELAGKLEALGNAAKPYNIKIGYHNHSSEFYEDEGKPILEYVIENTTKGVVWFQLDCGWAAAAGVDPAAFINKYPGRFMAVHVKENNAVLGTGKPRSSKEPPQQWPKFETGPDGKPIIPEDVQKVWDAMRDRMKVQCPMGDPSSRIDWKAVKAATDAQGGTVEWIVEREYDYLGDNIKCLAEDAKWLKENL